MDRPVLYSFRRCPYAMRARLAILSSGIICTHREVLLRDKPAAMLEASPKGTVPVLVLEDGRVIDESLDVMEWVLGRSDPEGWYEDYLESGERAEFLIDRNDAKFKYHLDRYKYETRYDGADGLEHRAEGVKIISDLNERLSRTGYLTGPSFSFVDAAIAPFIRQFRIPDKDWFDAQPWPHLHTWLHDFMESERFAIVMKKYPVWDGADDRHEFPETS